MAEGQAGGVVRYYKNRSRHARRKPESGKWPLKGEFYDDVYFSAR
ncbi:MAG: hypothetical protein ACTSWP_12265 [Candidatus Freyarchaeota archaeon]